MKKKCYGILKNKEIFMRLMLVWQKKSNRIFGLTTSCKFLASCNRKIKKRSKISLNIFMNRTILGTLVDCIYIKKRNFIPFKQQINLFSVTYRLSRFIIITTCWSFLSNFKIRYSYLQYNKRIASACREPLTELSVWFYSRTRRVSSSWEMFSEFWLQF